MKKVNNSSIKELPEYQCKNCGFPQSGNYCQNCGQKYLEGRFHLKESIFEVFDKVFNLERGIFFTIQELLLRPKFTLENYLNKATVRYMHPFRFVFILSTITALLTVYASTYEASALSDFAEGFNQGGESSKSDIRITTDDISAFLQKYLALLMMLSLPFSALATWIVYYKKRKNYAEHLINNSWIYGLTQAISLPFILLIFLPNGIYLNSVINFCIYFMGYAYVFGRYFEENFFIAFLKGTLISIISILMILILSFLIGVLYAFIRKLNVG